MKNYNNCTNCGANIYLHNGSRNFCGDCLKQKCYICTHCYRYTLKIFRCGLCYDEYCYDCLTRHDCPEDDNHNDDKCHTCHEYMEDCNCDSY